jgi:uncharacterized protein (TIRG00374 family)
LARRALPWLLFVAVIAFAAWKLHTSHFDLTGFWRSLRAANLGLLGLAILLIYSNNVLRALRWRLFLRPAYATSGIDPTPWYRLIGPQFIGFTGLAIFGRLAELIRPLLVARRTGLPLTSQVAVVTVERVFDLGAFGLIFALNLLLAPGVRGLPYLDKAGYTIAALGVIVVAFVAAVRLAGELVAQAAQKLFGFVSHTAGASAAEKILSFRAGLNVVCSFADFLTISGLSLFLWLTVALAYLLCLKAFPAPVHALGPGATIVLMGFSIAGSALPIPGGGGAWAGNTFALAHLFGITADLAAGAGLMVWLVTSIAVIPAGLAYAQIEGVSLDQVARRSQAVEEAHES